MAISELCRFDDFELDPGAYRLSRTGEAVRLERIPMELLCLLVERRG
jgi:DNA-binding winged helix-turn-helix (wHTH) protein